MLTACLRVLMLLTFTAHAVLGCCMHHQHQVCCQRFSSGWSQPATHSEIQASTCSHGCRHHGKSSSDAKTETPAPSNHSHDCDQPACSFLATNPESYACDIVDTHLTFDHVLVGNVAKPEVAGIGQPSWELTRWQGISVSASALCIAQNSWQL